MSDSPIRWDPRKKDQRDASRAAREAATISQENEARVKRHVGRLYETWKKQLRVKLKTKTLAECTQDLRAQIMGTLSGAGLDAFTDYTENLLNDVVDRVVQFERDRLSQGDPKLLPNVFASYSGGEPVPFHSHEEFLDIPDVRQFHEDPDCQGICTQEFPGWVDIMGAYLAGANSCLAFKPIGRCSSYKGIGKLPSVQQFHAAMSANGSPPGSSDAPPDTTAA